MSLVKRKRDKNEKMPEPEEPEINPLELEEIIGSEEFKDLIGAFEDLPEDFKSLSEEEFFRVVFIGDCPSCGSENTICCDEYEDIDDPTVALCKACGFMWCTECGSPLERGEECGHWEICANCTEPRDEFGDCGIPIEECPRIAEWLGQPVARAFARLCAWCGKTIPEDDEVFAVGAKLKTAIEITGGDPSAGYVMLVQLAGRKIPVIVTGQGSEARKEGNDWLFVVCSRECGLALKDALERERETVEKAELN